LFEPTLFSRPPIFAPTIGQITAVLMSGSLIFGVTAFSYVYNDPKYTDDLYSLFCITMLLVSPITWYHSCVLLLLPFGVLTHSLVTNDTSTSWTTLLLIFILCGVPNQDLIDGLRELKSTNELPWYVILGARTGLFGLILLYWVFWKSLARNAGYSSVANLLDSLRLQLLRPRPFQ
jgi:hypothetical protein